MTTDSLTGLPDCTAARILIIGDLMLDRYLYGPVKRISPEAPVPIVRVERTEERPGGAANVAVNIAALGAKAMLIGLVGDDEDAQYLQRIVSERAVASDFICCPNMATTVKSRVISSGQQLMRLDFEDDLDANVFTEIEQKLTHHIEQCDAVIFPDYTKGCLHHIEELIAIAKRHKKPIYIDPKGLDFARYAGATALTPNMAEFAAVVGRCESEAMLVQKAQAMRRDLDLECLIITRGEHGMTLFDKNDVHHLSTHTHEVYDVTGAGDTVVATFAVIATLGIPFLRAAQFANQAAGLVVEKSGAATVSPDEFDQYSHSAHSIYSKDELLERVADAKSSGQRVVMTNGCFDLLHTGHIAYLSQAARLGDRLVVAINDDASVKRLKGDSRPINPLNSRMRLVAALAMVDWVVPFAEDTPADLIAAVAPDVLVKGGDYRPDDIAGADYVKQHGGEVVVLDYIEGASTTDLINTIRS